MKNAMRKKSICKAATDSNTKADALVALSDIISAEINPVNLKTLTSPEIDSFFCSNNTRVLT